MPMRTSLFIAAPMAARVAHLKAAGIVPLAVVLLVLLLTAFAPSLSAQSTFGAFTGTVTDSSGAVVPAAQVVATERDTGIQRSTVTGNDGVYKVAGLQPGTYTLRIELAGFKPYERAGLLVSANHVVNVDARLDVASAAAVVDVAAPAPVISTESTANNTTVSQQEILALPLALRQSGSNQTWAMYFPGVGMNGDTNFYASGGRIVDMHFAVDGIVEMADATGIGGGPIGPSVETVGEFNAILANAPAEFKTATNFTVVTKSGTNQFHGSAYYDWNGNRLNARNFFAPSVSRSVNNNFAVAAGGPIKKDKLFFFADYDDARSRAGYYVVGNVPSAAWRNGDFSAIGKTIKDPLTGLPFENNQIPSGRMSSVATKAQDMFYPAANYVDTPQGGYTRFYTPLNSGPKVWDERVDYNVSSKDTIFGHLTYKHSPYAQLRTALPIGNRQVLRNTGTGAISWTRVLSPTKLNEFRIGFARNLTRRCVPENGDDVNAELGIEGIPSWGMCGVPRLQISSVTDTIDSSGPVRNLEYDVQLIDDFNWNRGSHAFKFGVSAIRDFIPRYYITSNIYGTYKFDGFATGVGYADFLLGIPHTSSRTAPAPPTDLRGTNWGFYAQDQFKATRRLTLNYGVRYELPGPYYDRYNRIFSFNPTTFSVVVPDDGIKYVSPRFPSNVIPVVTASQAGYPNPTLVASRHAYFYPRLGIAYKLTDDGKTVIRGGYGIYSNTIYGALALSLTGGPFGATENFTNSITNGTPLFSFPNAFGSPTAGGAFQSINAYNPNIRVPYAQQWNVTLERQIGGLGVSIGYLGTRGVNLLYPRNINEPAPSTTPFSRSRYVLSQNFTNIGWIENGGSSKYNALQIMATKRAGNLMFNASWTWASDFTDQYDQATQVGQQIRDQYARYAEWGRNPLTPVSRIIGTAVYRLPVGSRQRFLNSLPKFADVLLANWEVSAVVTLQSGRWVTPTFDNFDTSNTNNFGGIPDRVPGVSLTPPNGRTLAQWWNPAAFKIPGCPDSQPVCSNPENVGRFGNAGYSPLEGPPLRNLDLGLRKDFRVGERFKAQLQGRFLNALNHPNFGMPLSNISWVGAFGYIYSTNGGMNTPGSSDSRSVHVALRLEF